METLTLTKLTRVGNSLAVIIPRPFRDVVGWQRGDHLVLSVLVGDVVAVRRPSDEEIRALKSHTINYG